MWQWSWSNLVPYSGGCLEGQKPGNNWSSDQNLNPGPPEHEKSANHSTMTFGVA